jgi:hypothetical protein
VVFGREFAEEGALPACSVELELELANDCDLSDRIKGAE